MDGKYGFHKTIKRINDVITKQDIIQALKTLGIKKGMILYVQSQLDEFAYINGGNQIIIEALQEVVGFEGTIVTASFSNHLLDPACHKEYLFERDTYDEMRESINVFNKKKTPSEVGEFSNQWMRNEGVYRSNHPTKSFLAWGKYAKLFCDKHPLHFPLGKESPLDKLIDMNGYVVLLGVPCRACDIFKYSATCLDKEPIKIISTPVDKKGKKEFIRILEVEDDSLELATIQEMMEERSVIKDVFIASAHCRFFSAKEAHTLAHAHFNSFEND